MSIEHRRLNVNDRYRFIVIVVIKQMVTIKNIGKDLAGR